MRVLTIANQKGGVGKSAVVINLAAELAASNHRVLVVDLDPQGNATTGLGVEAPGPERGACALFGGATPAALAASATTAGVDVIGADLHLSNVEWEVLEHGDAARVIMAVRQALRSERRPPWDYVVIDTPPSLGIFTVAALAAADRLLVPVAPEAFSLIGLRLLLQRLDDLRFSKRFGVRFLGAVRSLWDPRTRLARSVEAHLNQAYPGRLLQAEVRRAVAVAEAMARGVALRELDPGSPAAEGFRILSQEVGERW